MKEQDKATARDLSETNINIMPGRKFKASLIRMLTGLEKRVEDLSETLSTEIRNTIAEIKCSINEKETCLVE